MASPRDRAASIATARFSLTLACPMNSPRRCGRSFSSNDESSSTAAAETRRSGLSFRLGLFRSVATASDGRTKCELAQLFCEGGYFGERDPSREKKSVFRVALASADQ